MVQVGFISLSADCCSCYLPEFQMSSSNYMIFQITFCCQRRCSCVSRVTVCSPHSFLGLFILFYLFIFIYFFGLGLCLFVCFLFVSFFGLDFCSFFFFFFFDWESFLLVLMEKLFTPLQLALSTHESEQSFRYFAIPYAEPTNI